MGVEGYFKVLVKRSKCLFEVKRKCLSRRHNIRHNVHVDCLLRRRAKTKMHSSVHIRKCILNWYNHKLNVAPICFFFNSNEFYSIWPNKVNRDAYRRTVCFYLSLFIAIRF